MPKCPFPCEASKDPIGDLLEMEVANIALSLRETGKSVVVIAIVYDEDSGDAKWLSATPLEPTRRLAHVTMKFLQKYMKNMWGRAR
jgi:hypothetical protein